MHISLFRCLWSIPLGLILVLFAKTMHLRNIEQVLLSVLGGMTLIDVPPLIPLALYNCGILLQLYLFGSIVSDEMSQAAVFLFSRSYNRSRWIISKTFQIILCTSLFFILLILVVIVGSQLADISVFSWPSLIQVIISLYTNVCLCNVAFVLLGNMLTIKLKASFTFLVVWVLFMPGQFVVELFKKTNILKMLYPSSQAVLPLHNIPQLTALFKDYFQHAISGFTPLFSTWYNILFIFGVASLGVRWIKRHDFSI